MGYYIYTCAASLENLQSALGSKNKELLNKIKQNKCYQDFDDENESFYKDLSLEQAINDIINGTIQPTAQAKHMYAYAFIALSHALQQKLPYYFEVKMWIETSYRTVYWQN